MPDITGTIKTPSGNPAENVPVNLEAAPHDPSASEAIGGVGILLTSDQVVTDAAGLFTMSAETGFRYRMTIPDIGYDRSFVMSTADVSFELLGLVPEFQKAADYTDEDGTAKVDFTLNAQFVNTVRDRFEVMQLEKSTAGQGGPYSLASTIELQDSVLFYDLTLDADNTDFFRVRYFNATTSDAGAYSEPRLADSALAALVCTVDELKELYLFGVDLTDNEGNPFPDRLIEHYIRAAVAWAEKELDIPITPLEVVDELHDHFANDYGRWGYFQLRKYPIIVGDDVFTGPNQTSVEVAFQYPSMTQRVEIDNEWVVIQDDGESGVIQLVPGQGNIADVLLIPGQLMPLWSGAYGRVPGVWRFTYRAGFEVGEVPKDVKHLIGMAASIGVFNIAGDLIAGAGIATISISVPGLNQAIGTTSSATNSGYGARIIEYQREIKAALPNLRRYYGKGSRMVVA